MEGEKYVVGALIATFAFGFAMGALALRLLLDHGIVR